MLCLDYIYQITDVHIDEEYIEGAPRDCIGLQCCRKSSVSIGSKKCGMCGETTGYQPIETLRATLNEMKKMAKSRYILFTMDIMGSDELTQSKKNNIKYMEDVFDLFYEVFPYPNYVVLPTIGNHDAYPSNCWENTPKMVWFLEPLAEKWKKWLSPYAIETARYGGYYSELIEPGLKVISLNHAYYDTLNPFSKGNSKRDTVGMNRFFEDELLKSSLNNEKVFILAHEDPGIFPSTGFQSTNQNYSRTYFKITDKYRHIIAGEFFGHTHQDLNLIYPQENPTSIRFVASAATPKTSNNPTFRYYKLGKDYQPLDYSVIYLDIDKCNANREYKYELLYTATEHFEINDLSPNEFKKALNRMKMDDSYFRKYLWVSRGGTNFKCDKNCVKELICIQQTRYESEYKDCKKHY